MCDGKDDTIRLAVLIINYGTAPLTVDCLATFVDELEPERDRAVVIDNASGDDSVERIRHAIVQNGWSDRVTLLASTRNGGFSAGHNLGIQSVRADFYLLLNSDTLVGTGTISELLDAAQRHPRAGVITPRLEGADGSLHLSGFRARTPLSELLEAADTGLLSRALRRHDPIIPQSDSPSEVDWASFACVLLRRSTIDEIGMMDEEYFMYFEDADYCRRARKQGWKVLRWPAARVTHLEGGSSSVPEARRQRGRAPAYYYASRSRYFAKFYGRGGLLAANLFWHVGRVVSLIRETIQGKERNSCDREWRDIWKNAKNPMRETNGTMAK